MRENQGPVRQVVPHLMLEVVREPQHPFLRLSQREGDQGSRREEQEERREQHPQLEERQLRRIARVRQELGRKAQAEKLGRAHVVKEASATAQSVSLVRSRDGLDEVGLGVDDPVHHDRVVAQEVLQYPPDHRRSEACILHANSHPLRLDAMLLPKRRRQHQVALLSTEQVHEPIGRERGRWDGNVASREHLPHRGYIRGHFQRVHVQMHVRSARSHFLLVELLGVEEAVFGAHIVSVRGVFRVRGRPFLVEFHLDDVSQGRSALEPGHQLLG
eukprot:scaffold3854_cov251-Pinguiococcus_pyrenoidosus.AAC.18